MTFVYSTSKHSFILSALSCGVTKKEHSVMISEEDIIRKEQDAIESEVKLLFSNEVTFVLETVLALLAHSKNLLKRSGGESYGGASGTSSKGMTDRLKYLVPLQVVGGALKGGVAVTGSRIIDGDIIISLPKWNKGQSYVTHLSNSSAWVLSQVENSCRFLGMANSELSELQLAVDDQPKTGLYLLKNSLERALVNISRAKNELMLHAAGLFPNSHAHLSKCFHPELPPDLVLEFHVFKGKLLASVYALGSYSSSATPSSESFVGHNVKYHGAVVNVVDYWEGEYSIPNFNEAVMIMDEVTALCMNLSHKAGALLTLLQ